MKLTLHDYISITIHQTDLILTNDIKTKLAPFNIAPEQNLIMMLLWEKDGIYQNDIAKKLNKDKTNIARMIFNLENKGFIRRIQVENDRRSLKVYLTEKGKNLGEKVIPVAEEFNQVVCKDVTEEELTELRRILQKIRNNIE